ncbi:MAG: hypothetical protein M9904_02395 [Chitinophagaceae bacterium]|nr:hypothetical protein [Chitinophagaceae bacterium]
MRILSVLLIVIFTSCITQKKCAERYPPHLETKDSIVEKEEIVYRDTTIAIPGDSVGIRDTIPCPDVDYYKEGKIGRTSVKVNISKGKIKVDCKSDSLQYVIDSLASIHKTKEVFHSETKGVPIEVVKYKTPSWCWWYLFITGGYVLYRNRKIIYRLIKSIV